MNTQPQRVVHRRVLLVAGLGMVLGCGHYDEVSPLAYEYGKALFSICNRKAEAQLAPIAAQIAKSATAGELSSQEARWLEAIIQQATEGDWESARGESRRLLEDQATGR